MLKGSEIKIEWKFENETKFKNGTNFKSNPKLKMEPNLILKSNLNRNLTGRKKLNGNIVITDFFSANYTNFSVRFGEIFAKNAIKYIKYAKKVDCP